VHGGRTQGHVREELRANGDTHETSIAGKYTQYNHDSPKVPDDIDNRAAYGRRQSPDFGFPGARIKLHATSKIHEASLDPGDWTKLGCGHFSNVPRSEIDSNSFTKPCHRCSAKCMTRDGRNDDLFHDLSHTIDTIVEEHTSTLRGIIDDIKRGQAGQLQDQETSYDLAPSKHDLSQRSLDYQRADLQVHDHPKKSAEGGRAKEVAAESTERDVLGLDGSKRSLERSIKSFQDLYDLINSAADDLGLDLDRRPSNEDDEVFRRAPVQEDRTSDPVHQTLIVAMENMGTDNALQNHDSRSESAHQRFSELSATRIQIMDEFGSIIEDISVQKPRVFKVKLSQSELPTNNDDGILTLQIRHRSSIQLPPDGPNGRPSCERLSSKPSPRSYPRYTATDPPPPELNDDLSPMSERKDSHGTSGTSLTQRTARKPESSTSSSYTTPCEYKKRLVGFEKSLVGGASAPTDLSTRVSQMTRSESGYALRRTPQMDDHGTVLSIKSFRDPTDLQSLPVSYPTTAREQLANNTMHDAHSLLSPLPATLPSRHRHQHTSLAIRLHHSKQTTSRSQNSTYIRILTP
jgi:hypothetical protein